MRSLVGAGGARAVCGLRAGVERASNRQNASGEQEHGGTELLVSAVCGRRVHTPSGIDLRVLAISIIFGANLRCVYILLVIYAILHRKNEYLFDRGQFG